MRKVKRSIFAILVAAGLLGAMAPAFAGSSDENDFTSRINNARSSHGLATLAVDNALVDVARRHSQDMADRQTLYHNDNLGDQVSGWQSLGENVGEGGSVADVDAAFLNSPEHRENILGNYTKVGVGVVWKDGTLWVTEVFELPEHHSAPPPQPAYTAPRPRPAVPVAAAPVSSTPRRRTIVRTAGAIPAHTQTPTVPLAVAVPLTSARVQKLLGDLMIVPPGELNDGDAADQPGPEGLEALLERVAANGSGITGSLAA